jgi:hypothetical protein
VQHLYRDLPVVPQVATEKDHGAPAPELALQHVPLSQRRHEGVRGRRIQGEPSLVGVSEILPPEAAGRHCPLFSPHRTRTTMGMIHPDSWVIASSRPLTGRGRGELLHFAEDGNGARKCSGSLRFCNSR